MPLIVLVSVKGSPGVTTAALALAAAWPAPRRLLAELDPAGGDLGVRLGLPAGQGLAGLAAAARRPQGRHSLWAYACELPGGLHVVPGPAGAEQAAACLQTLTAAGVAQQLAREAAAGEAIVIADCGRLDPGSPAAQVTGLASVLLVVTRPQLSDLTHLAGRLETITRAGAGVTGLVLVTGATAPRTDPGYPAQEIAQALGARVLGSVPADPRSAAALSAGASTPGRKARRLPLVQAARTLAGALAAALPAPGPAAGPPAAAEQGLPAAVPPLTGADRSRR